MSEAKEVKKGNTATRLTKLREWVRQKNPKATTKTNFSEGILGLPDMQPLFIEGCEHVGLCSVATIEGENLDRFRFSIFSIDDQGDRIEVVLPLILAQMRGCQQIQNLGGSLTYLNRYALYQILCVSSASEDPDKHPTAPPQTYKTNNNVPRGTLTNLETMRDDLEMPSIAERVAQIEKIVVVKQLESYWKSLPPEVAGNPQIVEALKKRKEAILGKAQIHQMDAPNSARESEALPHKKADEAI